MPILIWSIHAHAHSKPTSWLRALALVATVWSIGCAGDPMPPSRSPTDPANPGAPEAPMNAPASPMATIAPLPAGDKAPNAPMVSADAGITYTCPMHPEVQSNAPGRCPKCGMTLVPKKP